MLEPANEAETIAFYQAAQDRWGWRIVHLQREFPDAVIENARGQVLVVEFEYESRNFYYHGHDPRGCDLVICWRHNWPDAPLPVWALEDCIPLPDPAWLAVASKQLDRMQQRLKAMERLLYRGREGGYIDVAKPFRVVAVRYCLENCPPDAAAALNALAELGG